MDKNLFKCIARSLVCKVDVLIFHWRRKKWMDENLFKWNCLFIRLNKGSPLSLSVFLWFQLTAKCWDPKTWPLSYTKFFFTQTPQIFPMEEDAFLVQPNYMWEYPSWFQLLKRIFFPILGSVFFNYLLCPFRVQILQCTQKPAKVKFGILTF